MGPGERTYPGLRKCAAWLGRVSLLSIYPGMGNLQVEASNRSQDMRGVCWNGSEP